MSTKKNTQNIAVLITCHNRRDTTLKCLESLFNAPLPRNYELEVFLVDDGSSDGTANSVKSKFPQVNLIRGDGNLYWNKGMNLAWQNASEKSKFDFYLWLNDDVILLKDSLTILLQDYQSLIANDSIIAGACSSTAGDITYSGYRSLTKKEIVIPNGSLQQCNFFNGNLVLISQSVFEINGFLDSRFHHGQGDFDYGLRAKQKNINSYVSSEIVGLCERHAELPVWCNPGYSLLKRWKNFRTPLGGRPKSTYVFQKRYIGFPTALFHYFTIHLRLLFPRLWKKKNNV